MLPTGRMEFRPEVIYKEPIREDGQLPLEVNDNSSPLISSDDALLNFLDFSEDNLFDESYDEYVELSGYSDETSDESSEEEEGESSNFLTMESSEPSEKFYQIEKRETHPFSTQVGLCGGGRKKRKPRKRGKKGQNRVQRKGTDQVGGRHASLINSMLKGDYQSGLQTTPSKMVTLEFVDPGGTYQGATPFFVKHFKINDLYDPDPAILTTSYAGFAEWMRFYDFFRVEGIKCKWSVANNEATVALRVALVCTTSQLNPLTYQEAIDCVEGRFSSSFRELQRASGGISSTTFDFIIKPETILGDPIYYTDDNWYGTDSSSPLGALWCNLIVVSVGSGTNLTNGVTSTFSLRAVAKLWGVKSLFDPSYDYTSNGKCLSLSQTLETRKKNRILEKARRESALTNQKF